VEPKTPQPREQDCGRNEAQMAIPRFSPDLSVRQWHQARKAAETAKTAGFTVNRSGAADYQVFVAL